MMASPQQKDSVAERGEGTASDLCIGSDPAEARRVQQEIEAALKACQYGERDIFAIKLAIEEALVNAIKHGNQMDKSKKVQISYQVRSEEFHIVIMDEGNGFDPSDVPDPTCAENIERCCGRGLLLMRHYMNEVSFSRQGNSVRMKKVRQR